MGFNTTIAFFLALWAGAIEYTDCFSAEGLDSSNECPRYDTKQSNGEVPVLWGMLDTPLLTSLQGPLWPGVAKPVLSMGRIELNCVLVLNWIVWNETLFLHLSVCKQKKKLYLC